MPRQGSCDYDRFNSNPPSLVLPGISKEKPQGFGGLELTHQLARGGCTASPGGCQLVAVDPHILLPEQSVWGLPGPRLSGCDRDDERRKGISCREALGRREPGSASQDIQAEQ